NMSPTSYLHYSSLIITLHQSITLIPYTTLFRSDDNVKISSYSFENNDFDIEENIEELKGLDIILVSTYSQYEILKKYLGGDFNIDRKSTRLNSSHVSISYAVFCLKKIIKQLDIK